MGTFREVATFAAGVARQANRFAPAGRGSGRPAVGPRSPPQRTEAIRQVFPEYGEGYKCKITLPSILDAERLNVFRLTIQTPSGELKSERMPLAPYLQLVAATNYKQRVRKMTEYSGFSPRRYFPRYSSTRGRSSGWMRVSKD